jgi:4-amino-4-deoxy-L-arabinose transferase-like glycosyltransferase
MTCIGCSTRWRAEEPGSQRLAEHFMTEHFMTEHSEPIHEPMRAAPPAASARATPATGASLEHAGSESAGVEYAGDTPAERSLRRLAARPQLRHLAVLVPVAVSAVLNTVKLSQNGYANLFYSAGVKSMLRSWHNFVFVSFDPGGLITVDKPPLALWLQAASAKLFGFSPLSLLLPEAIAGVLAVALLYFLLARRLGVAVALAGSLALAVFPSFVAVSRDNGVDPVLILLMILACGAAIRAAETGRLRTLVWCGVIVGLAFNTKTLAAFLVVPGIALGYLLCAPGSIVRRTTQLLVGGLAMLAVSFAWIAFVDLTPASKRPYVGSSTNNSELGLTFEYNGLGRVEGQAGGPGDVAVRPGAYVPASHQRAVNDAVRAAARTASAANPSKLPPPAVAAAPVPKASTGREKNPIPFGGPPRLGRLFGVGLGDQAGWILPFALFGLFGVGLLSLMALRAPPREEDHEPPRGRRDPRLATMLVLGVWFLVEAAVLSLSKGIVHPYYVSAIAPGAAAMAGAGAVAFVTLARGPRRIWGLVLAVAAVATTVVAQIVLLHREHYLAWFIPVLIVGAGVGLLALLALRRLAAPAVALTFLLLLVAPGAYATTTWLAPVEGTFPVAGPKHDAGSGGYGVNVRDLAIDRALLKYVSTHGPGSRWALLTVASDTAAPLMLMGLNAGAVGGYSGTDPALDGRGLARLIAAGEARYVLLGGEYSLRGGNRATVAVLRACRELAPSQWRSPVAFPFGLVLLDCAGRERELAAE